MDLQAVRCAHESFVAFQKHKLKVLISVEHIFSSGHPLRRAAAAALSGSPFCKAMLLADAAACALADRIGDDEFASCFGGLQCTELFYGVALRTQCAELPVLRCERLSERLSLADYTRIVDLESRAEAFLESVRAFAEAPRPKHMLETCARTFRERWRRVLAALRVARLDLGPIRALLRKHFPAEISSRIVAFLVPWPQDIEQPPRKKRRLISRLESP